MEREARFYGLYRGICVNDKDPEKVGRVTLKVPQLFGEQVTDWAWPCVPPGWKNGLVMPHANHVFTDDTGTGGATETLTHTNNVLPVGADPGGHVQHQLAPKPGEGVWVMFEAGNPEYPVWLGVFR